MDIVIYSRESETESEVMRDYLAGLGFDAKVRHVNNGDPRATREWEDLDGEVTPLTVIDSRRVVRGFDRTRVDQLIGWIGC